MDPIMQLLEEDEDESMHSGAAVEAFTAALNRDIGGDTSTSHCHSVPALMPHGSDQTSTFYPHWQTSSQDERSNQQSQPDFMNLDQQAKHATELDVEPYVSGTESQRHEANAHTSSEHLLQQKKAQDIDQDQKENQSTLHLSQPSRVQMLEKGRSQIQDPGAVQNPNSESQLSNMQSFDSQPNLVPGQADNSRSKQIPFGSLLPIIIPELDKDRAMQLTKLYGSLRRNEMQKDSFVRVMRNIVGDQMLKVAVVKMQNKMHREGQPGPNQLQLHLQNSMQHHRLPAPVSSVAHSNDPYQFAQVHPRSQGTPADPSRSHSGLLVQKDPGHLSMDPNAPKNREVEHLADSHGMQVSQMSNRSAISVQGFTKQQQQNLHFPHTSYPMYGSGSFHPHPAANVSASQGMIKSQPSDQPMRQGQLSQGFGSTPAGGATQPMGQQNLPWQTRSEEQKYGASSSMPFVKQEPSDSTSDQQSRPPLTTHGAPSFGAPQLQHGSTSLMNDETLERQSSRPTFTPATAVPQNSVPSSLAGPSSTDFQMGSQTPASTAAVPGGNTKAAPKKSSAGQKKPLDAVGSSPPLPSKKQKVTGGLSDQSIEQLNDVTAVSGVNLREEEEQLFSGPKDDTRASEASRKVVQEEEDKLILQKLPLQKKLAEIMTKCGLKNLSNDVERCLSLCVEERLRGLLSSMIRISRQRADSEKSRHRTVITSDVRQQILEINRKVREEWDKKQAEADKLRKLNEPDSSDGADGDKDDKNAKLLKVNKEEDDKMRTTAANVAARAAVGGDDMLSKWQLMAEQARQKREGVVDPAFGSFLGKESNRKNSSTSRNQGAGKKDQSGSASSGAGGSRRSGRNQGGASHQAEGGGGRNISVKDVIAVLERETQTAKSTMLYRLYERVGASTHPAPSL